MKVWPKAWCKTWFVEPNVDEPDLIPRDFQIETKFQPRDTNSSALIAFDQRLPNTDISLVPRLLTPRHAASSHWWVPIICGSIVHHGSQPPGGSASSPMRLLYRSSLMPLKLSPCMWLPSSANEASNAKSSSKWLSKYMLRPHVCTATKDVNSGSLWGLLIFCCSGSCLDSFIKYNYWIQASGCKATGDPFPSIIISDLL